MKTSRRGFLVTSAAAAVSMGFAGAPEKARDPMRILILGGTGFLGPHQVEYARRRGHKITLFNRGKTAPDLFPDLEQLHGDRDNDLESLKGRSWDVVIDNSASIPRWVRQSAQLLSGVAERYLFVSSLSVFSDNSIIGMTESAPVGKLDDPTVEKVTGETYGPLKALCEAEAEKAFPGRALVIRPGLIVGPRDRSDRFTYWPVRIDRGGEVMAPGSPTDPVQIIDVRDLAGWMIDMLEQRGTGVYNATGPKAPLSMSEMLYGIRAVTSAEVSFTWVPADFLEKQKVRPWSDMPVWVPSTPETAGFSRFDCNRAFAAGLSFRPLAVTARDTLDWFLTLPRERREQLRAGISPEREREVLQAWKTRPGA